MESVLTVLINDLYSMGGHAVLVLDDYHAIHGEAVHDFLSELLRHWPQRLHLVLISRSSPPFPLASLRATGQVAEIRTRDLRFTSEEAAAFLKRALRAPHSQFPGHHDAPVRVGGLYRPAADLDPDGKTVGWAQRGSHAGRAGGTEPQSK
jgi:hypothetical protein